MGRRLPLLVLALAAAIIGLVARPAAAAPPNDPRFATQWGLTDIKAPDVWDKARGGGMKVAVVSTGIAKHPDLTAKTDGGFDATRTPSEPTVDTGGRGTHLAGTVGAATNNGEGIAGVAPDARLLPYKAFESASSVENVNFVKALVEVQKARPQVALVDIPEGYNPDPTVLQALKNLGDAGISVAVGASGPSLGDLPVLTVAGSGPGGGQVGASGVGPRGVTAPAGNVVSTTATPGLLGGEPTYDYGEMSGTPQAAAHVAGALAILRGLGAGSGQAADLLRSTARKSGNTAFGAGMIDVAAAVAAYRTPPATTTTMKAAAAPTTKAVSSNSTLPKSTVPASLPSGPGLSGEQAEPGTGEEAVVPPGAEDFLDSGATGGPSAPASTGKDRPLGLLAIGFGLLGGVGTGLSITFRRLADAAI